MPEAPSAQRGTPLPSAIEVNGTIVQGPALLVSSDETTYVTETATGLIFRDDIPFEVWGMLTARLIRAHQRLEFALADAINFGHRYGERYSAWVHESQLAKRTLHNIAYVGRQIESSRRREDISFSHHAEVAQLPPKMQDTLLDLAVDNGWKREELRAAARQAQQHLAREAAAALPAPALHLDGITLGVADAATLPLPDGCVDLIITSPPYALEKPYGVPDTEADQWPRMLRTWLTEAFRVTKPSGRLALNVALDTTDPYLRPAYAQAVAAALSAGWEYRFTIAWIDNATTKGNRALGSINSASRPHHISQMEMIVVLSKGVWAPSGLGHDDISGEQWQEAGRGPWVVNGETRPWEGHPAAFPLELPRRLIRYLCRVGDVVLDPFSGSCTTAVAAYELGRQCYAYDLDPACIASGARRLALVSRARGGPTATTAAYGAEGSPYAAPNGSDRQPE